MNAAHQNRRQSYRTVNKGFTLLELAVTIAVVAILSAFAWTSLQGSDEARDAAMVQSAQAALQSVVSQGSARTDTPPANLTPLNVLNAMKASFNSTGANSPVKFTLSGNNYTMTMSGKNRTATFGIGANGDVKLVNLSNFTDYTMQNGVIFKP